jgi:hypothetical protein
MLSRKDTWFAGYLIAGYLAFAEALSWETSKWPLCLVVSEYHSADNHSDNQACATFHEGIMRGIFFLWGFLTHDHITAAATVVIAVFTFTLWQSSEKATRLTRRMGVIATRQMVISRQQTDIQRQQHTLNRLQFFATNRPRLYVRHVSIVDQGARLGLPTFFWDHGTIIQGGLVVVNWGGSSATIVETRYRIYFSNSGLPATAPYDDDFRPNLLLPDAVLQVGESCAVPISDRIIMEPAPPADELELRRFQTGNWKLYVMGQIRYRDENNVERFMGFCRERGRDGIFQRVVNEDYEYED